MGFRNYTELMRPFTLIYPFIAVLAGGLATSGGITGIIIFGAVIGSLLNGASNAFNQYCDIDSDRTDKPHRPLPSGRIGRGSALSFSIILYIVLLAASLLVGPAFFLVVLLGAVLTIIYSAQPVRTKSKGFLGNITLAVCRGFLPLIAGWVIVNPIPSVEIVSLAAILGLFVLGANTAKDFSDISGDSVTGTKTLPVIYGKTKTVYIMMPFLIVPFLLIPLLILAKAIAWTLWPLTLLAFWGVYISHLLLSGPERKWMGGNHPAWVHMYLAVIVYTVAVPVLILVG
jgi:4-hydroxybenzoate polyprenyltransferase